MARKMKDSGIEWIGEIPEGWEITRLKYLADFEPTCDTSYLTDESEITYTPMECVKNGDFENRSALYGNLSHTLTPFQNGDIAMAKVTPCFENGNIAIMNNLFSGFGLGSSELFIFRPKSISTRYLFYWLQNKAFVARACSTMTGTGGLKRISPSFIRNCPVHCPSMDEQTKISDYLKEKCSEIDTMLSKTRSSIEEYKKLKQAVITQAVTKGVRGEREMKDSGVAWIGEIPKEWAVSPMKHFIDILPGYAFSSDDFCIEEGIPLLRGINVGVNEIRWDETVRWNHSISKQLESFFLKENDLVVGLDRPWISDGTRVAFIAKKDLPCLLLQRVCRIRTRCNFDIRWIYYWLSGSSFKDSLSTETTGISVPHISTKQIEQFLIAFPNQLEQTQICNYLDITCAEIDKLIAKKEQLVKELESYKKSLIYEVVTGKREV